MGGTSPSSGAPPPPANSTTFLSAYPQGRHIRLAAGHYPSVNDCVSWFYGLLDSLGSLASLTASAAASAAKKQSGGAAGGMAPSPSASSPAGSGQGGYLSTPFGAVTAEVYCSAVLQQMLATAREAMEGGYGRTVRSEACALATVLDPTLKLWFFSSAGELREA